MKRSQVTIHATAQRQRVVPCSLLAHLKSDCLESSWKACGHATRVGTGLTDGGGLIEVGGGELRGGVDAGPAPEHDAL